MEECTAATRSLTYALKAERVLGELGYAVRIVKPDTSRSRRGCEYGIAFDCRYRDEIKHHLRMAGIAVLRYQRGGGEIF